MQAEPAPSRASFAPTGPAQTDLRGVRPQEPGRLLGRLATDVDLGSPVNHAGRTQALWSGHPGIHAGIAALGHGWPFAAGPRSNACVRPAWLTGRRNQRPPRGGLVADLALTVVHPSDLFEQDLWEQSLLARRPDSRPISPALLRSNCGSEPAREEAGRLGHRHREQALLPQI